MNVKTYWRYLKHRVLPSGEVQNVQEKTCIMIS